MAKRRFTQANVNFLSLCVRGKNRLPVIYKAEGDVLDLDMLVKADTNFGDNGELTAIVYAPEFRDRDGDIASADVIKKAMYDASRKGVGIDIRHNEKALPKDQIYIAENFIVQKGDARFNDMKDYEGNPVDVTGAWAVVLKVEDAELRKAYREGGWNGISMAGTAAVVVEKSNKSEEVINRLVELLDPSKKETPMPLSKEDIAEIAKSVKELIAPAPVAVTKTDADTAPLFKGDMSDVKAIREHRKQVKIYDLRKSADLTTDEGIDAYEKALSELNGTAPKIEKSDREIELESELADLRKSSNQTVERNSTTVNLSKEETQLAMGLAAGKAISKRRGYAMAH